MCNKNIGQINWILQLVINQYTPLDDKNIARDRLCKLQQCGSIQEYIIEFNSIVVALPELAKENGIYGFVYI